VYHGGMAPLMEQSFRSPILAGRAGEVIAWRRLFERAHDGIGHVVLLSGEVRIGKSRLVGESKAIARD